MNSASLWRRRHGGKLSSFYLGTLFVEMGENFLNDRWVLNARNDSHGLSIYGLKYIGSIKVLPADVNN